MQVIKESNGFTDLLNGFAQTWGPKYMQDSSDQDRGTRQLAAYKAMYDQWVQSGKKGPPPAMPNQQQTSLQPDQASAYDQQAQQPQNAGKTFSDLLTLLTQWRSGR